MSTINKEMENINDEAIISNDIATEYGFIEKLCATFGFIKCLNKDNQEKRLFFHSSEVKCGFEEMKIGDYVTFMRGVGNGKPLAKKVAVQRREGEREDGIVLKMPKKGENGSISYKFNEECYYVSFDREAMMDHGKIKIKDEVSFERIEKDGVNCAINVCKKYNKPIRIQGVVTCIKDKYGFIDRCDVVKEIYFNIATSPEYLTMVPGTEVEFNVKHLRNGKEEAVNLHTLEKGTVNFEDVYDTILYGTLLRCPDVKKASSGDQLTGNISYACPSEATVLQIPFGEKDKLYPYSLHPGDIVAFKIAVDRRDELHHACQVQLCLDQFPSRKETRHFGVIKMYDAPAGLIESDFVSRSEKSDTLVAFKNKEWLVPDSIPLTKFMSVSYTPIQLIKQLNGHTKTTTAALRIMPLKPNEKMTNLRLYPAGSLRGIVNTSATTNDDLGIVICQLPSGNDKRSIPFSSDDIVSGHPKVGDEVMFGCLERITNQKYFPPVAFNIKLVVNRGNTGGTATPDVENVTSTESRKVRPRTLPNSKIMAPLTDEFETMSTTSNLRGWIVILKEYFGFVETSDHRTLYKFSPFTLRKSNLQNDVDLGTLIEFVPLSGGNGSKYKRVVDVITKILTVEYFSKEITVSTARVGIISQPITITEVTESQYHGLIVDCEDDCCYPYTMMSLSSFRTKLYPKDRVMFNVSHLSLNPENLRASHIVLMNHEACVIEMKDNKVYVERILDDEDYTVEDGLATVFTIDCDKITGTLVIGDVVQLDLDLDFQTREVFVASHKLLKSAEPNSVRKSFKNVDESQARILHLRKPRLPQGDSVGFSEDLRREPILSDI